MESTAIGLIPNSLPILETKVRYCLYARKSTESDEQQALSIDSQIKEMTAIAERLKLNVVTIKRESHSAKESGQRPVFKELLGEIAQGTYNGILTWAPDRLSRNAGDLGTVVDLMDQKKLIHIQTYGQTFSNSPNEKFLLMILCSQAKLENDNKSINVKRGLRARVEMGLWPCRPPTGYTKFKRIDQKCESIIDPMRAPIIKQMFEKIAYDGWSGRKVFLWLRHDIHFKTEAGKSLSIGNLYKILNNHFYYGRFEFPKQSGNWYNGSHEPIITKELFDLVQEKTKNQRLEPRLHSKEFAFTKLMTCGLCGSGITADEKFKYQKNGNVLRYVYYKCARTRDAKCPYEPISEPDLVEQFITLMDTIDLNEIGIKEKIKVEVERIKKFQRTILGIDDKVEVKDIDIRNYSKYVLAQAPDLEKRELLECFKSRIIIKQKIISLE